MTPARFRKGGSERDMTKDVAGRTAFITGGANGIGLGIARAFAKAGVKIALADIEADALARAKAELGEIAAVTTVVLDVRDRARFEQAADEVDAVLGPVSLLFNNAGVAGGGPADKMTYELWDWGMGINLNGVINGVQTFLPRMVERGAGGHIVNTASGAGLAATGNGVLYHTAKYAVVGMAEALALELGRFDIGVSVLCPGPVATDIIRRTRGLQPRITRSMSEEQLKTARARNAQWLAYLAGGVSPDAVGEQVLEAVRADQLYIHTDRSMGERIAARAEALIAALPPEARAPAARGQPA
jgi:NAD(P)-dependent dehydrogenase (short-subunit alcohol dehydrogenase family)